MTKDFNIDDISNLASIRLEEKEKLKLQKDLEIVLEHVDALKNIDVKDEKIDIHPLSKILELREDESTPSLSHEDAMKNSPETKDGHFVVPPSIE